MLKGLDNGYRFLQYISLFIHLLIYFCHADDPTMVLCMAAKSQSMGNNSSSAIHLKCKLIYYCLDLQKHLFQLFSSCSSPSLLKRIPGSKNYTEQQGGTRESQSDDAGERLFFLRSVPDEVLKDQKTFTPSALDRVKDQVQPFLYIKISQTIILDMFSQSTTNLGGEMLHFCP